MDSHINIHNSTIDNDKSVSANKLINEKDRQRQFYANQR